MTLKKPEPPTTSLGKRNRVHPNPKETPSSAQEDSNPESEDLFLSQGNPVEEIEDDSEEAEENSPPRKRRLKCSIARDPIIQEMCEE